ncbi:MAG: glycosyltransferase [bacterium]|nr:glycosyltransferase [bacterium]
MSRTFPKLVIVSHVPHFTSSSSIFAYAPYAREIDIWADLFPSVTIAAPRRNGPPAKDTAALTRPNVRLAPQPETGGTKWHQKLWQLVMLPVLVLSLSRALWRADAVHVRCPGNLGLVGVVLAPLFSRRLVAKYAGQWTSFPGEPWSFRLQRFLLRSRWWRGPVTVYGDWPDQPEHVLAFFTTVLDASHLARAREAVRRPWPGGVLRVLFVGRLARPKNVDRLLAALALAVEHGTDLVATIAGDGPERRALEAQATGLGLSDRVTFTGGLPFESVLDLYERHDVLALISECEGWPKAIAEAMAFGLIAIGSDRGLVPRLLAERGIVVPAGDHARLAVELEKIARSPQRYRSMREAAASWSQQHSLEGLREALRDLMAERWNLPRETFQSEPHEQATTRYHQRVV